MVMHGHSVQPIQRDPTDFIVCRAFDLVVGRLIGALHRQALPSVTKWRILLFLSCFALSGGLQLLVSAISFGFMSARESGFMFL